MVQCLLRNAQSVIVVKSLDYGSKHIAYLICKVKCTEIHFHLAFVKPAQRLNCVKQTKNQLAWRVYALHKHVKMMAG